MEFRREPGNRNREFWQIKLKGSWYDLCACVNCSTVRAFCDRTHSLHNVVNLIKCCKDPFILYHANGAKKIIDSFVTKWGD